MNFIHAQRVRVQVWHLWRFGTASAGLGPHYLSEPPRKNLDLMPAHDLSQMKFQHLWDLVPYFAGIIGCKAKFGMM